MIAFGVFLLTAQLVSAEWFLLDDFEGDPASPNFTYTVPVGQGEPVFHYVADPFDPENSVFWVELPSVMFDICFYKTRHSGNLNECPDQLNFSP